MNLKNLPRRAFAAARSMLVMSALLMATTTATLAATTKLLCDTGLPLDMGPTTVELNQAQNEVTVHLPALRNGMAARTLGPRPAVFAAETITFTDTSNQTYDTYEINRLSGTVAYRQFDVQSRVAVGYANWTCRVATQQF